MYRRSAWYIACKVKFVMYPFQNRKGPLNMRIGIPTLFRPQTVRPCRWPLCCPYYVWKYCRRHIGDQSLQQKPPWRPAADVRAQTNAREYCPIFLSRGHFELSCRACGPLGTGCACPKGQCNCEKCVNSAHSKMVRHCFDPLALEQY